MGRRDDLMAIFRSGLAAVEPAAAVRRHLRREGGSLVVGGRSVDVREGGLVVVGGGKAAPAMARAVEEIAGDLVGSGLVCTKHGHAETPVWGHDPDSWGHDPILQGGMGIVSPDRNRVMSPGIEILEAGHPVPDAAGEVAARRIAGLVDAADEDDIVLCLLSGGGSALLPAPCEGLTLAEKVRTTELLLGCGATIDELNCVRKHLSLLKGGRLAARARPASVVGLLLSDVVGDDPAVIASGPTAPDATTFADAVAVIDRYGLRGVVPAVVLEILQGERLSETPGPGALEGAENVIIGDNRTALEAAAAEARVLGYEVSVLDEPTVGEARDAGTAFARLAREASSRGRCLLAGGETTVTVRGEGRGGRNQELALAFAIHAEGLEGATLLSVGTDGTDGPTDAAGAIADGGTIVRAREAGLDPQTHLERNDSYTFFERLGDLVVTGPTGTNVTDMQVLMVEGATRFRDGAGPR